MTVELAIYLGQQGLITALMVAGPLLCTALVVGSLISIIQTVTQVQEMTLVFVPKILAVFLVLGLAGSWMLQTTVTYGVQLFESIPDRDAGP